MTAARRFLLPAVLAAGVLLSLPAQAQTHIVGAGMKSCGTWSADRRMPPPSGFQEEQWVLGYLSGIGIGASNIARFEDKEGVIDPLNGVDAQAVWAWVDNYCRAQPLEYIATAVWAFYRAHPR